MKRLKLLLLCAVTALGIPLAAQEGQAAGQGRAKGANQAGPRAVNVRFDLTITDQTADGKPLKKSIMWVLADGFSSRVRSTGMVHEQETQNQPGAPVITFTKPLFEVELNVDATVRVLDGDRMRSEILIQYTPGIAGAVAPSGTVRPSPLNESVTVILTSGKPLVITQAADPVSDRKITAEVTATILR